jgi:predicted RNA-binding protein with RPS1 domain
MEDVRVELPVDGVPEALREGVESQPPAAVEPDAGDGSVTEAEATAPRRRSRGKRATSEPAPSEPGDGEAEGSGADDGTNATGADAPAARNGRRRPATQPVVTLRRPFTMTPPAGRSPSSTQSPGGSEAEAGKDAKARGRVMDEVVHVGDVLLARRGIRWYRVVGTPRITLSVAGLPELAGEYKLRPASPPKADQLAEGAAVADPDAERDPLAYLYRLQQNRLVAQREVVGIEFHRIDGDKEEPCLVLMFGPIKGLIPVREADVGRSLAHLQRLLGQVVEFHVLHVDPDAGLALLSRRSAREAKREQGQAKTGQVRRAVVRSVLHGAAFVDIGLGREAVLPAAEYEGRFLIDLTRHVRVGDEFDVVIKGVEDGYVVVSRAALLPDPWESVARRYQQGGYYPATIVGQTPNRAYIMLELPDSTLCYARHPAVGDPPVGSRVKVKLRGINRERRRLYVDILAI